MARNSMLTSQPPRRAAQPRMTIQSAPATAAQFPAAQQAQQPQQGGYRGRGGNSPMPTAPPRFGTARQDTRYQYLMSQGRADQAAAFAQHKALPAVPGQVGTGVVSDGQVGTGVVSDTQPAPATGAAPVAGTDPAAAPGTVQPPLPGQPLTPEQIAAGYQPVPLQNQNPWPPNAP